MAFSFELVASFHECQHCSLWPSWRPRAGAACGTVSKIRGTPRQRVGWHAHDPCMFCSRTPEMFEPYRHAFSPHISRGYADRQNSQPVKMHQVLMNLCANAEYAMRDTGGILEVHLDTVELDTSAVEHYAELVPGSYVRLTIRDTGHGITPEVVTRVFEPF